MFWDWLGSVGGRGSTHFVHDLSSLLCMGCRSPTLMLHRAADVPAKQLDADARTASAIFLGMLLTS